MALDWKDDPTRPQPTDAELEELAAGISDMRYGGPTGSSGTDAVEPDADSTGVLPSVPEAVAPSSVAADDEADEPKLSALSFIIEADDEPAAAAPEPATAPTPAPAPSPTPAPAPAAPAPTPIPAPQPALTQSEPDVEIPHPEAAEAPKEKKSLLARLNEPIDKDKAAAGVSSLLSKRGGGGWPTKTSINLYVRSERELNPRKIILVSVVAALAVIAFLKFGVFDQMARVTAKELEYSTYQTELLALQAQLTDYDEVREQYEAYNVQTSSTDIDVLGAFDMVDRVVKPSATVVAEQVDEDTLTLVLKNANLETYGNLVTALAAEVQVSNVTIKTANNTNADSTEDVTATLTVTLRTITQVAMLEEAGYTGGATAASEADSGTTAGDIVSQTVDNVTSFTAEPNMDVEE